MMETPVKLRTDLEVYSEADASIIIKDPIIRRFYRFTPVQATVIRLLAVDGNPQSVAEAAAREHQTEVLREQVEVFVEKLRGLLLLEHPWCWMQLEKADNSDRRKLRNLLYIKCSAFNPDQLLTTLHGKLRFFFHPAFNVAVLVTIAVAIILAILHGKSIFLSLPSLLSLYSIPLMLAVIFVVITIHEFGHSLTLKHFGGKVEEMGFMLLYFLPAFYCNVSDAWMLKKRERILVSFAGGYIETFIWALAIVAWRILSPETPIAQVCLIIVGFTGIKILFNFIPLIRLDGYYMLSDYVEVSNLRPKALRYLRESFLAFLSGNPTEKPMTSSPRERKLFFWYGSVSAIFSIVLIVGMLGGICGWLIRNLQFWGIVLSTMFILVIAPSIGKEKMQFSRRLTQALRTRIKRTPFIYAMLLLAILIIGMMPWQLKVAGEITIVAMQKALVSPQVAGNLKVIHVDEGDRVSTGQALAQIENLDLENQYEETRGELATQQAELDLLYAGARPEEIENARRLIETRRAELENLARIDEERAALGETVAKRMAELQNARLTHERSQNLWREGVISLVEADRDRTAWAVSLKELAEAQSQLKVLEEQTSRNLDVKQKELAQAQSALDILLAGNRKEAIQAAEAQMKKLAEKLEILGRQKQWLLIRSPIDGVVTTSHLSNRLGDFLDKGDTFCEIVNEGTLIIEMPVPEKEIGDVRTGFPIQLKFRSAPKFRYETSVREIAPVAAVNYSEPTVIIRGELTDIHQSHAADVGLKAGMTGVGKILCGRRTVFELVSRRLIRWIRTEFWEYLP